MKNEWVKQMKHEQLKSGDIVVFKRYCDIYNEEVFQDGIVIGVYPKLKEIDISWLEGYKSRNDSVKYEKVIAKGDENGQHMRFNNIVGKSILLSNFEMNYEKVEWLLMMGVLQDGVSAVIRYL